MLWAARLLMFAALLAPTMAAGREGPVRAAASIAPVHSLLARVMEGAGTPALITPPNASPHYHAMRPSAARALNSAELVVWIGPALELWMTRPLQALADKALILQLSDIDVSDRYRGGAHHDMDPHFWLNPDEAVRWTRQMAEALAQIDPANAKLYHQNAAAAMAELEGLAKEIEARLAPFEGLPYVVFHDAYGHFEERFDVAPIGVVTISDARKSGAAHVARLRDLLRAHPGSCVFAEPQFEPRLVETLIEGASARRGVVDPIGAEIEPGPKLYPQLLRNLASGFEACFTP